MVPPSGANNVEPPLSPLFGDVIVAAEDIESVLETLAVVLLLEETGPPANADTGGRTEPEVPETPELTEVTEDDGPPKDEAFDDVEGEEEGALEEDEELATANAAIMSGAGRGTA